MQPYRVSSRDSGKTAVDAALGEVMVTCEKIWWLVKNGQKWLKPEYRSAGIMVCFHHIEKRLSERILLMPAACCMWPLLCIAILRGGCCIHKKLCVISCFDLHGFRQCSVSHFTGPFPSSDCDTDTLCCRCFTSQHEWSMILLEW